MDWGALSVIEGEDDITTVAKALGVTVGALLSRCRQLQETLHTTAAQR